jgi:hypothetical protein
MLDRDKHSRLLRKFVNYGCKKFSRVGPRTKMAAIINTLKDRLSNEKSFIIFVPGFTKHQALAMVIWAQYYKLFAAVIYNCSR